MAVALKIYRSFVTIPVYAHADSLDEARSKIEDYLLKQKWAVVEISDPEELQEK